MKPPEQIQSWPTPVIFITRRGKRIISEYPRGNMALEAMGSPLSQSAAPQDEPTGLASFALSDFMLPGPLKRTLTDPDPKASFRLDAFGNPQPVSRTSSDPDARAAFALSDFRNVISTSTRTVADPDPKANFALSSFVVTP